MLTSEVPPSAVHVAMLVASQRMDEIGRDLHPHETRWLVRRLFRILYPKNPVDLIERFSDLVIIEVIKRCREECRT